MGHSVLDGGLLFCFDGWIMIIGSGSGLLNVYLSCIWFCLFMRSIISISVFAFCSCCLINIVVHGYVQAKRSIDHFIYDCVIGFLCFTSLCYLFILCLLSF